MTRRARHNSIEQARHAMKVTDVAPGDFVLCLHDAKTGRSECTVQKTYSGEE